MQITKEYFDALLKTLKQAERLYGIRLDIVSVMERLKGDLQMGFNELKADFEQYDAALKNIEDGVKVLIAGVKPGMTEEEVATIQVLADSFLSRLKSVADETPDAPVA